MHIARLIYLWIGMLCVAVCATMMSCATRSVDKPIITVSIQPQKYLLEQIAGKKFEVRCLLTPGANPETYDPSMTHMINLENSRAYFQIGHVPFESAIINKIKNNNPDLRIYDNSEGVAVISGHGHGAASGHAGETDPHTWTSVRNARKIASNMYSALLEIDPDNKSYYTRRFNRLVDKLDRLDDSVRTVLAPVSGRAFVVWHPSLSYFARDYGLRQIALSPESKEISVSRLRGAMDAAREAEPTVMLLQKDMDSRQASVIAGELGIDAVDITPLSYEWEEQMLHIAHAIANDNE